MKLPRRKFLHLAAGAAALPALSRAVRAQTYPTRQITLIVPFPPGGSTDVTARVLVERMRPLLGQPLRTLAARAAASRSAASRALRRTATPSTSASGTLTSATSSIRSPTICKRISSRSGS